MPRHTISIVTYTALNLAQRCVQSVLDAGGDFRLILTANGNRGAALMFVDFARRYPAANIYLRVNERNEGFIVPHRRAFEHVGDSEFFTLLNDDMTVVPGWLDVLAAPFAEFPTAALSAPRGGCTELTEYGVGRHGPSLDYLEGACLMGRVDLLKKHGLFAPELVGAYCEDADLSLRMREAGHTIHEVDLKLPHVRGATSCMVPNVNTWMAKNHAYMRRRWGHYLKTKTFASPC